jgi:hypothetical protein
MVRTRACSANTWPTVLPGRNAASQDLERLGPGVEHVAVARVGLAGQDHVHQRRMVVPIRGGDLELHLISWRDRGRGRRGSGRVVPPRRRPSASGWRSGRRRRA